MPVVLLMMNSAMNVTGVWIFTFPTVITPIHFTFWFAVVFFFYLPQYRATFRTVGPLVDSYITRKFTVGITAFDVCSWFFHSSGVCFNGWAFG